MTISRETWFGGSRGLKLSVSDIQAELDDATRQLADARDALARAEAEVAEGEPAYVEAMREAPVADDPPGTLVLYRARMQRIGEDRNRAITTVDLRRSQVGDAERRVARAEAALAEKRRT